MSGKLNILVGRDIMSQAVVGRIKENEVALLFCNMQTSYILNNASAIKNYRHEREMVRRSPRGKLPCEYCLRAIPKQKRTGRKPVTV